MSNIKKMRENANLTQAELATVVGVGQSTVAMWETGQSRPRIDAVLKLSEIFRCTADELLGIEHNGEGVKA